MAVQGIRARFGAMVDIAIGMTIRFSRPSARRFPNDSGSLRGVKRYRWSRMERGSRRPMRLNIGRGRKRG